MSIKLFKNKDGVERRLSDSYSVFNYLTAVDSDNVSLAVGEANDHNETTKSGSDRVYYVLSGEFIVNGNIRAREGDIIFIPADTEYKFKGTFKVVIINSPPFKKNQEKISKIL